MVELPSRDMKEHNGTTPVIHTLTQQNIWPRGTDAQIMQTCDTAHADMKSLLTTSSHMPHGKH